MAMKRVARASLVGCVVVLTLAMYLTATAEVLGRGDGGHVEGRATSVTPTRGGVQVCVADARSTRVYCGETSTVKAEGFRFHLDQCVLIDIAHNVVLGVATNDSDPCATG